MRRTLMIAAATALLALSSTASARDTRVEQSLQELVSSQAAKDAGIDGSVRFYLAGQPVSVQQRLGEDVTNKKTNAANKSDAEACRWVALSALRALQDGARSRGANAVVTVDLAKQEITGPDGGMITFDIDPFRKQCLLDGLDDIDLTMAKSDSIDSFEARQKAAQPWLHS